MKKKPLIRKQPYKKRELRKAGKQWRSNINWRVQDAMLKAVAMTKAIEALEGRP